MTALTTFRLISSTGSPNNPVSSGDFSPGNCFTKPILDVSSINGELVLTSSDTSNKSQFLLRGGLIYKLTLQIKQSVDGRNGKSPTGERPTRETNYRTVAYVGGDENNFTLSLVNVNTKKIVEYRKPGSNPAPSVPIPDTVNPIVLKVTLGPLFPSNENFQFIPFFTPESPTSVPYSYEFRVQGNESQPYELHLNSPIWEVSERINDFFFVSTRGGVQTLVVDATIGLV